MGKIYNFSKSVIGGPRNEQFCALVEWSASNGYIDHSYELYAWHDWVAKKGFLSGYLGGNNICMIMEIWKEKKKNQVWKNNYK